MTRANGSGRRRRARWIVSARFVRERARGAAQKPPRRSGSKGVHAPVTEAAILERLEARLKNSAMGTSLPRLVIGDVAYPRSPEELEALGGMALLLVTACSQDQLSCRSNG